MTKTEVKILLADYGCTGEYSGKDKTWYITKHKSSNYHIALKQDDIGNQLTKYGVKWQIKEEQ